MAIRFRLTDPSPPVIVEAWRKARKRLPDLPWASVDGGAEELITPEDNIAAFRRWWLRQRCLTGVTTPRLSTTMARQAVAIPMALPPTGETGISHLGGDVAASRAAERAGVRAMHSTAGSERGVAGVLEIFRSEFTTSLTLMGCANVAALDCSWLAAPRPERKPNHV